MGRGRTRRPSPRRRHRHGFSRGSSSLRQGSSLRRLPVPRVLPPGVREGGVVSGRGTMGLNLWDPNDPYPYPQETL